MSCRSTRPGSLATTFIAHAYDLEDGQDTALFHAALRQSRQEVEQHGPYDIPTLQRAYHATLDNMEAHINGSDLTAGRRSRALQRVSDSRGFDVAAQPHTAAAVVNISSQASLAKHKLQRVLASITATAGVSYSEVQSEFSRLHRGPDPDPDNLLSAYDTLFDGPESLYHGVPTDKGTRKALRVLLHGARCPSCGQFVSLTTSQNSHTCPQTASRAPETRRTPASASVEPESTTEATAAAEAPISDPVEPPLPWDMEEFQAVYDEIKARIDSTGNRRIPTDPSLEAIPGGVTGGLGARDGGLSFGVELEMDFPDDDYPYSSRYLVAQKLYEEGLVMSPHVERWHFVGTGDRPGGEYTVEAGNWVCEFDRSVDDCEGERGMEIKSQILYDEPETWQNLRRICEIAEEYGAKPTMRTGLHVNVDGSRFPTTDPARHNALLRLAAAYDDTIVRLAHNPESGPRHRGRAYCRYVNTPAEGFRDVNTARDYSNHYQAFNLGHLPGAGEAHVPSTRVEHRIWDATLDPGRIQTAVTVSLALVQNAVDLVEPGYQADPAGTHHNEYGRRKLSGERWESATLSFRQLVALLGRAGAKSEHHRRALTSMFAATRWQN